MSSSIATREIASTNLLLTRDPDGNHVVIERLALITRQLAELQRELSVADGASATS